MTGEKVAAEITVTGRVQGVGYRFFTERAALAHGIMGWSMNISDGSVKLDIEGNKNDADLFIDELKKGPRMAHVTEVSVAWKPFLGRFSNFSIKI